MKVYYLDYGTQRFGFIEVPDDLEPKYGSMKRLGFVPALVERENAYEALIVDELTDVEISSRKLASLADLAKEFSEMIASADFGILESIRKARVKPLPEGIPTEEKEEW